MALILDKLLHCVVLLSTIKYSSAYCYGYCWYGSWYIWFGIVIALAICCGAIGSYIRRRQIQKAMRNQRTQIVTVDINGQQTTTTTTMSPGSDRPYVYPQGGPNPYHSQQGAAPYPTGAAPYPTGAAPYPTGAAPFSAGAEQYPNPNSFMMNTPPPYSSITTADKDEKISQLPPSYQEAVRNQGIVNEGATFSDVTSGSTPQPADYQPGSGTQYSESRMDAT